MPNPKQGNNSRSRARRPQKSVNTVANAICFDDIEPREMSWLWPGRIALGRLTVLAGGAGVGKSLLSTEIAKMVSLGGVWPDGAPCPQGTALVICDEDNPSDTSRPRLDAAGADCERIHLLSSLTDHEVTKRSWCLNDTDKQSQTVDQLLDCKLAAIESNRERRLACC